MDDPNKVNLRAASLTRAQLNRQGSLDKLNAMASESPKKRPLESATESPAKKKCAEPREVEPMITIPSKSATPPPSESPSRDTKRKRKRSPETKKRKKLVIDEPEPVGMPFQNHFPN